MKLTEVFAQYRTQPPMNYGIRDTSHGEADFRLAVLADWTDQRLVIKLAANDFTTVHRVTCWRDTIDAYRAAGFDCPRIVDTLSGECAMEIAYEGRTCTLYAEEHSPWPTAEQLGERAYRLKKWYVYHDDALRHLGTIASLHLQTADFPSGLCILEPFCPSEMHDEVWDNALAFRALIEKHQPALMKRFSTIWERYTRNLDALQQVYGQLPTSVFQADLNHTNVLLDSELQFRGVLDFHLAGRDTVLNCLFRELMSDFDFIRCDVFASDEANTAFLEAMHRNIRIVRQTYTFSPEEKRYAILLYRYLRPFWWQARIMLEGCAEDRERVERLLTWIEREQTREIDFETWMA